MRGYFGIGVEGVSKAMNAGNLFRTGHAFGAGFIFTVAAVYARRQGGRADTSDSPRHVPFYAFPDLDSMLLPQGCALVGVELVDGAVDLPSFHHPPRAAYVLGRERGSVSDALLARCDHVIRIPMQFCVNLGTAGAIVMYDRLLARGRFAPRPPRPGGPVERPPGHAHGDPVWARRAAAFEAEPPVAEAEEMTREDG